MIVDAVRDISSFECSGLIYKLQCTLTRTKNSRIACERNFSDTPICTDGYYWTL